MFNTEMIALEIWKTLNKNIVVEYVDTKRYIAHYYLKNNR